jgi:type VI protein secretion system component VasK
VVGELGSNGVLIFIAVFVVFAVIVWLIVDVLRRTDLSAGAKAAWIIAAFLFTFITLAAYVLFGRQRNRSAR